MTATLTAPRLAVLSRPDPLLLRLSWFVALTALPLIVAYGLDDRRFQGDDIWLKPKRPYTAE